MPTEPQNLIAAREYARLGWHVFPLAPRKKTPLTHDGFYSATLDLQQIEQWWLMQPAAGIGIATGTVSRIVVLDIDPRSGGHDALMFLEARHAPLPPTVEAQTGGGGRHIYFALPSDAGVLPSAKPWGDGVEVKADGAYVCAPFTTHPSGLRYFWREGFDPNTALAPLPAWILDALRARQQEAAAVARSAALATDDERLIYEGRGTHGGRDNALTSLAGTMRNRGMSYESILRAMLAENEARCRPPLPEADVARIVRSISRYASDPTHDPGVPRGTPPPIGMLFSDITDLRAPAPISWLLDSRVAFGDVCLLVGAPGAGKSWLTYEMAVAGAMGLPILGSYQPSKRLKVLVIDEENPQDEVLRRLWLLSQAWGIRSKELAETLMVGKACQGWSFRGAHYVSGLHQQVEQFQPDLIIFDSLIAVSTVKDEGDAIQVRQFFHDLAYPLRSICNSTMVFVHHTNKSVYQFERPVSSAGLVRGSIDFVAAVDSALMIEQFKVKGSDRFMQRLEAVKVRRGQAPPPVFYELIRGVDGGLRPMLKAEPTNGVAPVGVPETELIRMAVLEILERYNGEGVPVQKLRMWLEAQLPHLKDDNRRKTISRMVSEGLISFYQSPENRNDVVYFLGSRRPLPIPE